MVYIYIYNPVRFLDTVFTVIYILSIIYNEIKYKKKKFKNSNLKLATRWESSRGYKREKCGERENEKQEFWGWKTSCRNMSIFKTCVDYVNGTLSSISALT